jgi:hypothetical protein
LDVDNVKLKELIDLKQQKMAELAQKLREEQFKLALKRFIRKAQSKVRKKSSQRMAFVIY